MKYYEDDDVYKSVHMIFLILDTEQTLKLDILHKQQTLKLDIVTSTNAPNSQVNLEIPIKIARIKYNQTSLEKQNNQ